MFIAPIHADLANVLEYFVEEISKMQSTDPDIKNNENHNTKLNQIIGRLAMTPDDWCNEISKRKELVEFSQILKREFEFNATLKDSAFWRPSTLDTQDELIFNYLNKKILETSANPSSQTYSDFESQMYSMGLIQTYTECQIKILIENNDLIYLFYENLDSKKELNEIKEKIQKLAEPKKQRYIDENNNIKEKNISYKDNYLEKELVHKLNTDLRIFGNRSSSSIRETQHRNPAFIFTLIIFDKENQILQEIFPEIKNNLNLKITDKKKQNYEYASSVFYDVNKSISDKNKNLKEEVFKHFYRDKNFQKTLNKIYVNIDEEYNKVVGKKEFNLANKDDWNLNACQRMVVDSERNRDPHSFLLGSNCIFEENDKRPTLVLYLTVKDPIKVDLNALELAKFYCRAIENLKEHNFELRFFDFNGNRLINKDKLFTLETCGY